MGGNLGKVWKKFVIPDFPPTLGIRGESGRVGKSWISSPLSKPGGDPAGEWGGSGEEVEEVPDVSPTLESVGHPEAWGEVGGGRENSCHSGIRIVVADISRFHKRKPIGFLSFIVHMCLRSRCSP